MNEVQGDSKKQHGNSLMRGTEYNGDGHQKRRDAKHNLKYCCMQQRIHGSPGPLRKIALAYFRPVYDNENEGRNRKPAMIELHRRHVIEKIPPERFQREKTRREPVIAHHGKRIVDLSGFETGDKSAGYYGYGYENE
jgi:hypothetical protein